MALILGPLFKTLAAAFFFKALSPREEAHEGAHVDTTALDELASTGATSTATSESSSATIPVSSSPSSPSSSSVAQTAEALASPSSSPSSPSSSPSSPSSSPSSPPSSPSSQAESSSASIPVDAIESPSSSELSAQSESRIVAARELHAYIMRTTSARRDREYIRTLQSAMGGVAVDGLIGRETARRIFALTGLRIAGLS